MNLILWGGGLDSLTILYWLKSITNDIHLLYISYDQDSYQQELERLCLIHQKFQVGYSIFDFRMIMNRWYKTSHNKMGEVSGRQLLFMSYACGFAQESSIKNVFVGIKPSLFWDSSLKFVDLFTQLALGYGVYFQFPLITYDQIEMMIKYNVDPTLSWSCYFNEECDNCLGCKNRKLKLEEYYARRRTKIS